METTKKWKKTLINFWTEPKCDILHTEILKEMLWLAVTSEQEEDGLKVLI